MGSATSSSAGNINATLLCNHFVKKLLNIAWKKPTNCSTQMNPTPEDFLDATQHYSKMFAKMNDMRITAELTDAEIYHGNTVYPCHSIVLFCRSYFFEKVILESKTSISSDDNTWASYKIIVPKDKMKEDVLKDLMTFIYLGEISIPKERLDEYLAAAKEWDLQYISSCEKVRLGHYEQRSSISFIFKQVFSDEELVSPYITIQEKCFEANVLKKLSTFCPLPTTLNQMHKAIPSFDIFISDESGTGVCCHRALLASFSEYFYAMLGTSNFIESSSDEVVLKGVEASVLVSIIQFIYTTKIDLTEENAHSITVAAGWLCLGSNLIEKTQKYLVHSLSYENCVSNLLFAKAHSFGYLHQQAARLANHNLPVLARSSSFSELTFHELCCFLCSNDLSALNEMEIFFAFELWARDKSDEEMTYDAFRSVVRLSLFTTPQLELVIAMLSSGSKRTRKFPQLCCSADIARDFDAARKLSLEMPVDTRMLLYNESFRNCAKQFVLFMHQRAPSLMEFVFLIYHIDLKINDVKSYSGIHTLKSCCATPGNGNFGSYAATVFDNCVYITGGGRTSSVTNQTLIYHPSCAKCWRTGPSLLTARYGHSMVAVRGSLYVLGGFDSNGNIVKSVERLDYSTMKWVFETTLFFSAPNMVCACFDGKIYVFAMARRNNFIYASLHCYCTKRKIWLQPTSLGFKVVKKSLCFFDAVFSNNKMYVFAEAVLAGSFTTVSVFDPITETWYPNVLELQGSWFPFVKDDKVFICSSILNTHFQFAGMHLLRFPLNVEPLVITETLPVDKRPLIYKLPVDDNDKHISWLCSLMSMKSYQKRYRPAFLQLHSYYPQSEPQTSLLD